MRLQGLSAIVTGGASGFGAGIAEAYVREGAKVVILDLNGEGAKKVADEIGAGAIALGGDVTKKADVDASVKLAVEKFGKLDIVVNNAGWTHRNKPLLEVTEDEFDKTFAINVKSIFLMTNACVPVMKKQGSGRIVNISSVAGLGPTGSSIAYAVSKAGLIHLTKCMAVALAPEVLVNCVAPGLLEGTRATANLRPEVVETGRKASLLGVAADKDDCADQVVTMCRTNSTTGQTLVIDSGRVFH